MTIEVAMGRPMRFFRLIEDGFSISLFFCKLRDAVQLPNDSCIKGPLICDL